PAIVQSFAIEQALVAMKQAGALPGRILRVAIVGPGLDFADKRDGYDFYPQQTLQPFAVIDSLLRLGLARPGLPAMTTFDVSGRVNQHLQAARARAQSGQPYPINAPRDT